MRVGTTSRGLHTPRLRSVGESAGTWRIAYKWRAPCVRDKQLLSGKPCRERQSEGGQRASRGWAADRNQRYYLFNHAPESSCARETRHFVIFRSLTQSSLSLAPLKNHVFFVFRDVMMSVVIRCFFLQQHNHHSSTSVRGRGWLLRRGAPISGRLRSERQGGSG